MRAMFLQPVGATLHGLTGGQEEVGHWVLCCILQYVGWYERLLLSCIIQQKLIAQLVGPMYT